jgi:acetylornithine deacetylase/succinyl-diaminopimelate desuccinylase-like protein
MNLQKLNQITKNYAANQSTIFLNELISFAAIPSISTEPECKNDMNIAAEWVSTKMKSLGMDKIRIFPTGGHPLVFGEYLLAGEDAPTILIYGHYDVQPSAPIENWDTDPFKPEVRGDHLYGRGVSDMKGQIAATLFAVESLIKAGGIPVNLKFMIEGEEEIGSPNLHPFIVKHKEMLSCDFVLNTDTGMISPELPTITYALRGLAYFEIRMWGPDHDLHSGVFGGTVHNPAQALTELISGMHTEDGKITLPGFYNNVKPLGEEERAEISRIPRDEDWYLENTGAPALWGETEFSPEERVGSRPTLEVNGLFSGFIGEGGKTVIPAYAMAKISCRLVPDQDPDEVHQQLLEYCKVKVPQTIRWEVIYISGGKPSISDRTSPWIHTYGKAAEKTWGVRPVFKREGGSVPVVSYFQEILGVESVNIGFGLPTDNMHGPNEKLHLPTWYKGIDALINYFYNLGQI